MRGSRTTNDRALAVRMVGVVFVLAGVLLCFYGWNAYASAGEYGAGMSAPSVTIRDRDRGLPIWVGASSIVIGVSLLFIPRREEL